MIIFVRINSSIYTLNPDNLEALCTACHNTEHFGGGNAIAAGLHFDSNGEIAPN